MTIETSTANVLLTGIIALQCWIIRELFKLKAKITVIANNCPKCRGADFDTDRITRNT